MEYKRLFDVVISVAADPDDRLKYLVMIFNRLNGSDEVLSQSSFDSSDEALDWTHLAFDAFKGGTVRDRKPAPA